MLFSISLHFGRCLAQIRHKLPPFSLIIYTFFYTYTYKYIVKML
nr:MAG TPA: hypothetical protein [Caudoviricetes sp.]